mmetsp:Transcript_10779/g.12365  ORF Transcript_10779/g.12365 Transcript_10779/m.12365 type:complete len:96 (-) Transcript_10779:23-310(-)
MFSLIREFEYWDDRNKVRFFSSAAGLLFAFGWWLFIDSAVYVSSQNDSMVVPPQLFLLGVAASLSLLIIVCIDICTFSTRTFVSFFHVALKFNIV